MRAPTHRYPREFKSREAAGQNRRSPYQFSGIGDLSPTLCVTAVVRGACARAAAAAADDDDDDDDDDVWGDGAG
jgi:hypothetical protein